MIVAEEGVINQLAVLGRIRVGLVWCKLEKTVKVGKCKKCWAYDHTTNACDGQIEKVNVSSVAAMGIWPKTVKETRSARYVKKLATESTAENAHYFVLRYQKKGSV